MLNTQRILVSILYTILISLTVDYEKMNEGRPKDGDNNPSLNPSEKEALLAEYQEMREELRENGKLLNTRISGGVASIVAVCGYALLAPGERSEIFISIVPVIIGVIYLLTLNSLQNMLTLSRRTYDIEEKIMPEGQGWEHQYGGLVPHGERLTSLSRFPRIDLRDISSMMVVVLSALIYFAFVVLSLWEINKLEITSGLTPLVLSGLFYFILTTLLLAALMANRVVFIILQPDSD